MKLNFKFKSGRNFQPLQVGSFDSSPAFSITAFPPSLRIGHFYSSLEFSGMHFQHLLYSVSHDLIVSIIVTIVN